MTDPKNPDQDEANGNDPTDSLPPGVPEPPDMAKVNDLRERMNRDRSARAGAGRGILRQDRSQQARDVGTYTIIPMMMIAGPLVGYLLGKGIENIFGGEPWPGVVGMLFGMVAAFRQVFLLLAERGKKS